MKNSVDPFILYFVTILVFGKFYLLFKLIFKATQFQKIPEYNIFQKILFCTLVSSINLEINATPVAESQYL